MSGGVHSPYDLVWMDSCLQETLLPGSPWTKVVKHVHVKFVAVKFSLLVINHQLLISISSEHKHPGLLGGRYLVNDCGTLKPLLYSRP